MTSGGGRSAGTVIPSVGSGRYAPGPNIALPSLLRCWTGTIRQMSLGGHPKPGIYTTVSTRAVFTHSCARDSAVLPSVQPSQPKPTIMIPIAPMTPPQNPGFTHGGTCIYGSLV